MDLRLAGKRALVTGSSSGIGEAIVKLLAAEGVAVVVHGRDESRANAVAKAIRAGGGKAEVALGDLTTDAGADAVAVAALSGGPIDILVNNAGVFNTAGVVGFLSWTQVTATDWAEIYNTNVISGVRMIQRLVPADARATLGSGDPDWWWPVAAASGYWAELQRDVGSAPQPCGVPRT